MKLRGLVVPTPPVGPALTDELFPDPIPSSSFHHHSPLSGAPRQHLLLVPWSTDVRSDAQPGGQGGRGRG